MDALDLFQLGRRLTKLGEEAMRPFGGSPSRPGRRLVLIDALAFPDSSVGEIATRTGLPQSYVSGMVAKLRDLGILETRADPADRRRTLVKGSGSLSSASGQCGWTRCSSKPSVTPLRAAQSSSYRLWVKSQPAYGAPPAGRTLRRPPDRAIVGCRSFGRARRPTS